MAALAKATSSGLPIAKRYTVSESASGESSSIWILPIAYGSTALITAARPTERVGSHGQGVAVGNEPAVGLLSLVNVQALFDTVAAVVKLASLSATRHRVHLISQGKQARAERVEQRDVHQDAYKHRDCGQASGAVELGFGHRCRSQLRIVSRARAPVLWCDNVYNALCRHREQRLVERLVNRVRAPRPC